MSEYRYLDDEPAILAAISRYQAAEKLYVDTEFMRIDTFYPLPALVQVQAAGQVDLIDPLALSRTEVLASAMGADGPTLVMHACSEDIEVLQQLLKAPTARIHDTQIGLAFLGYGLQLGYQGACEQLLGVHVDKGAARSDWLQRPLSDEQRHYAAQDVVHLPALYAQVSERLNAAGLWDFFVAECDEVCQLPSAVEPSSLWCEQANAWRLRGPQRWLLQQLLAWREAFAIEHNAARSRVLKNATAYEMALHMPSNHAGLSRLRDMHPRQVRTHGNLWINWVQEAQELTPADYPEPVTPPLPREASVVVDALKQTAKAVCDDIGVPLEVFWRKRLSDKLLLLAVDEGVDAAVAALSGWRAPLMQTRLRDCLHSHLQTLQDWGTMRSQSLAR